MPRLTDRDYLRNYELLRSYRMRGDRAFPLLKVSEQQALFSYYGFHERRGRAELLEHRRVISRIYPSLPHQAGRALTHLNYLREHPREPRKVLEPRRRGRPKASRAFSLAFEVRPEPDVKQLARAFIDLAEHVRLQGEGSRRADPEWPAPSCDGS